MDAAVGLLRGGSGEMNDLTLFVCLREMERSHGLELARVLPAEPVA